MTRACSVLLGLCLAIAWATSAPAATTYRNPVPIQVPGDGLAESFADPSIIRAPDGSYYAYGTSDPLTGSLRDATGALQISRVPIARSTDLVNWTIVGEALPQAPAWAAPDAGLWAPDIRRQGDRYLLYFTVTDTTEAVGGATQCGFDPAIGVAESRSPAGPFVPTEAPVVAPRRGGAGECEFLWTIDPAVVGEPDGSRVLYYGSYFGGIEARRLSPDGLTTDPATARRITVGDRYEGAYVLRRGGWYYFFGSSTDCCRGPLTGYSVFAGRSRSPFGPFRDRQGVRLDQPRVGGTPVISMNGNRWVGPGHNAVVRDRAGQYWFVYHAIDRTDPYFAQPNPQNILKRPMLIDRLTWEGGWPQVRNGRWASDSRQPAPVTEAGGTPSAPPGPPPADVVGSALPRFSDEFDDRPNLGWSWVRAPAASVPAGTGELVFPTQPGDIGGDQAATQDASVLVRRAPAGDFVVETKLTFDLPPTGVFNYRQAGLVLYGDDDRYLKLVHVAIWETRQIEWAKEVPEPLTPLGQRYGNTVLGPPAESGAPTWLRIVRRATGGGQQRYTAYSSLDGRSWVRGGTWTHSLAGARIGLVAMGGAGSTARFDYVRTYRVHAQDAPTAGTARLRDARTRRSLSARRGAASVGPMVREELPSRR